MEQTDKPVDIEGEGSGYGVLAILLLALALVLGLFGLYRMFAYGESDKIVGGDAYNYTILATRGVGLICAGILCAVASVVFVLMRIADRRRLVTRPIAHEAAPPTPVVLQPGERTIICWNCGKDYGERSAECPHCGKVKAMTPTYR